MWAHLDMWSIDIAVSICLARHDTDTVVIIWNDILETILFAITFQRGNDRLRFQSSLGNLLKLCKQLAVQFALQHMPLQTQQHSLNDST